MNFAPLIFMSFITVLLATTAVHAQTPAPATPVKDLSIKLYDEAKPPTAKPATKAQVDEGGGSSAIIRCTDKGRVTFTNTKCEGGQTAGAAIKSKVPAENQLTRSSTAAAPKPLAALPPLHDTVQATNNTAGYELREQCNTLNGQLARLDSQAQLALPKPEPEASRKKRAEIERKKFSLRCG
jgi:hypothetical protein